MKRNASGRFVVRLPPKTHQALRNEALRRGVSLNALCQMALERHVSGQSQFGPGQEETPAIVGGIRELLGDSLLAIVMFGSVARGDSRDGSDIDLLIALNRGRALKRNIYSLWDERFPAQEHNPHFVHLPLQTLDAGSLWLEAAVDGVVQYDRDG